MPDLSTEYMGLKLKNPFIVSSSGFSQTAEGIVNCEKAGASAVVMKSLFEEEMRAAGKDVSQSDYYHAEVMEYLRSEVELEYHAEGYFETIREAKKEVDIPIIASLNATASKWWIQYAQSMENAGADALELNLYFLDISEKTGAGELEKRYLDAVKEVRAAVSIPIAVKLSRYFTALPALVFALEKIGVESVVLFNRFLHPDIDLDTLKIKSAAFLDDPVGFHYALRWISYLYGNTETDIAASGGVHNYSHLAKYLLAGADAVESCSVLYEKGLGAISEILKDLEKWMDKKGVASVKEMTGKAISESNINREEYLRAQFVKTVLAAGKTS